MNNRDEKIIVFSDGGCRIKNNSKGNKVSSTDKSAYAYRIEIGEQIIENGKGMYGKTNNQMELQGFSAALTWLVENNYLETEVTCYLDSKYVLDGIESWMTNWKKNGWRTASKKEVANKEEWLQIDSLLQHFNNINYIWVKGHAESEGNISVDRLLNEKMDELG